MNIPPQHSIWAIVPAAGIGARMQSGQPKQYLEIQGQTILEITLQKLLQVKGLSGVLVALHPEDKQFARLPLARHEKIRTVEGGSERCFSVENALTCLQEECVEEKTHWALVHDAARPCVSVEKIESLIKVALEQHAQGKIDGGILVAPCADTVKRVDDSGCITQTEDRESLWLAHTPQLFPVNTLLPALKNAGEQGFVVTDEASAIEHAGGKVAVVLDRRDNIKVTVPEDLSWAENILTQQGAFQ